MCRKKAESKLSPEIRAVLRGSPNLQPCSEFGMAPVTKFLEHVNRGQCEQCRAFWRQMKKELEMMHFLSWGKN